MAHLVVIVMLVGLLFSGAAAAEPAPATIPSRSPATAPARPREFRFDALRIDGALRGPEAVVVGAGLTGPNRALHRNHRSFLHRIFETVEAPGLHGGR